MTTLKRTPLFAAHQRAGARLVDFGGWEMPVQYSSIVDEHLCVRRAAGIFDISHMGEVIVFGPSAETFLNHTLTNDVRRLVPGRGQYTLLCNERGGVIDDLYLYRTGEQEYLLVINAARIAADVAWLNAQWARQPRTADDRLSDVSDATAAVAIQGPQSAAVVNLLFPGVSEAGTRAGAPGELRKNELGGFRFEGQRVWVARTGYTGEDGFELITANGSIEALWNRALAVGHPFCLQPCGLGARDTLRTEMGYPLYGHELDENTTPLEAGLGGFVALDKEDFIGREALLRQKTAGVSRKCVAFKMTAKSPPPRPGYAIVAGGQPVGTVVSGTQSPSLGIGIGMGYVPPQLASPGTAVEIQIRAQRFPAQIAARPLYRRP